MESGHPLGLFTSSPEAPRVIITNGLMVGCFDNQDNWHSAAALGVANYGQMTAGGWMYIGPQGIVHGTYNTLLNAGRAKLGIPADQDLAGQALRLLGARRHERRAGQGGRHRQRGRHHRGGRSFAHQDPPRPGLGRPGGGQPGRGLRASRDDYQRKRQSTRHRLPRQHRRSAGIRGGPARADRPALRPDLLPCGLRGRLLPPGHQLRRAHRAAAQRTTPSSGRWSMPPCAATTRLIKTLVRARHLLLRLRQQLSQGGLRCRRDGDLQKRRERQGRVHLPVLCRGHHGAAALRLRLRAVPLGLPERQRRRSRQDRSGGHGVHRPRAALPGPRQLYLDPRRSRRIGSWSAPRPASSTRTRRGG